MFKKAITRISILAIVIGSIFLANGLILAWTAPTASPTGSNVSAPLNISGTAQTKSGTLISSTDIRAPIFYDQNNTGYYVNPASNSWLYRLYSYDLRSDIYYDRNNTGYYVDPASTSRMDAITPNSITLGGVNRTTWPTSVAEADTLQSVTDRGTVTSQIVQSNASVRAPIFYDSNNTGYYVNPASTSKLNNLTVSGQNVCLANGTNCLLSNYANSAGSVGGITGHQTALYQCPDYTMYNCQTSVGIYTRTCRGQVTSLYSSCLGNNHNEVSCAYYHHYPCLFVGYSTN